jgi:hypothetical protein
VVKKLFSLYTNQTQTNTGGFFYTRRNAPRLSRARAVSARVSAREEKKDTEITR